jgi:hypothetical protein
MYEVQQKYLLRRLSIMFGRIRGFDASEAIRQFKASVKVSGHSRDLGIPWSISRSASR